MEKLCSGLTVLVYKKTTTEQQLEVLGRMTKQCYVVQKRSQYSIELERAILEATLTIELLNTVANGIYTQDKNFKPEDIVIYYEGVFLEFIHTIKDKILRLVWWMMQNEDSPLKEPDSIRLKNFNSYKNTLEDIDIFDFLYKWDQNSSDSGIAVCLRKRTYQHHFISNLKYNSDFQNIQLAKIMLTPEYINNLSEYGMNEMEKLGENAYKKWRNEITIKELNTLKLVKENIESISLKLIDYYKIPVDLNEQANIMNEYLELQKNFKIVNKTSIKNFPTNFIEDIKSVVSELNKSSEHKIISVYVVGSLPRGEFISDFSDINLIIIMHSNININFTNNNYPLLNIQFINQKEFFCDSLKKYRFICKYDGLLINGEEIKFDEEEFPKPGLFLAILLNKGFIEELENIKNFITKLQNPTKEILRLNSLKAVRIMLDFIFGVAMANKPFYTSSRIERIQYIKEIFPESFKQTILYENIYLGSTQV